MPLKSNNNQDTKRFSYYEYKYLINHRIVHQVKGLLNELYGGSDPYPSGVVDSIYYDTMDEKLLHQCLEGNSSKIKFRIRGYGNNTYLQMHEKKKDLCSVRKKKCALIPIKQNRPHYPPWDLLTPKKEKDLDFKKISFNSSQYGILVPSIRIKYKRFRYRTYDYRITLDTNIEVSSVTNGIPRKILYGTLPDHVLEIKTTSTRPCLPFLGILKIPQVSFSKFMLGIQMLNLD